MQSPATAWEGALRRLQAETPEFAFQAWILPLDARLRDNHLELRAPSPFHLERVRSRHLDEILAAVREEDRELQVTLQLAEKAPARPDGEPDRKPAKRPASADSAIRVTPARVTATPSPGPSAPSLQAELAFPDSFSTFVVGEANALAREASLALAVGRQPGVSPLYLMGPTGTGKSHLARALVAEARRSGCERPVYVSCEGFTTELMRSIRSQQTEGFRRRFRSECDLLVIEDVQFLTGKNATQLELFHTVEHLCLAGRSVAITGDRLPRDIPKLDPRLASRLASGLVAEMEPPDQTLRRAILKEKASRGGVRLPEECLEFLVDSVRGSVRDLEGVLIQLVASASLLGRRIDLELAETALRKVCERPERHTVDGVIDCVASFFGTTHAELIGKSRRRAVVVPRQLAMYLCRRFTDASLSEIGRALGRDHPSVSHALRTVERGVLERAPLRYQVEELVTRLEGRSRGAS